MKKLLEKLGDYAKKMIKSGEVLNLTLAVLEAADDANAENPASSSGKYHPVSDLGPGGNVRHTVIVTEIAQILMNSHQTFDDPRMRDIVTASCILHDVCKYDSADTSHTQFDHPILAANLIREIGGNLGGTEARVADLVAANVNTHMGRFTTSKKAPTVKLEEPKDLSQWIVHYADIISANRELPLTIKRLTEEAEEELK
jgi:hypothetical protein